MNDLLEQMRSVLEQLDQQTGQPSQETMPPGDAEQGRTVINVFFVDEPPTEEEPEKAVESTLAPGDTTTPPQPSIRHVKPAFKRLKGNAFLSLAVFTACLLLSLVLVFLFIIPSLFPIATVTIMPVSATLSTKATLTITTDTPTGAQILGRLLPPLTLSQSEQVKATGHRHQDAAQAEGTITFYNGQFISQTVAAGTILTGSDGVQVAIDQEALIPAGNPPSYGQVTVAAHAVNDGPQGNIASYDINEACCLTSVLAKNTEAFQGGQDARTFPVVTKRDIDTAAAALKTMLAQSAYAALQAQRTSGEALLIPPCSPIVTSDHLPGEVATEVSVSVSETCEGIAYKTQMLYQKVTQLITKTAAKRFGTGYSLRGNIAVSGLNATITVHTQGIATIAVRADATYVYQISPGEKQQILTLIAGRTKQQAVTTLLHFPGIQTAAITIKGNTEMLPINQGNIHIIVVYRSV